MCSVNMERGSSKTVREKGREGGSLGRGGRKGDSLKGDDRERGGKEILQ